MTQKQGLRNERLKLQSQELIFSFVFIAVKNRKVLREGQWYIFRQKVTHISEICIKNAIRWEDLFWNPTVIILDFKIQVLSIQMKQWGLTGVEFQLLR